MKDDIIDEFLLLLKSAEETCYKSISTTEYEPIFRKVLQFIETHTEHQSFFKGILVEMVTSPTLGPWELIPFCMHRLRWGEIKDAAQKELDSHEDWRVKNVMSKIIDSFSDDWQDADLYQLYS